MTLQADVPPQVVTYCHCNDCRRLSGAPVAAFAAFPAEALLFSPDRGRHHCSTPGVERWACPSCGAQLSATYDYLPDQVYVPVGILDQASEFAPSHHSHVDCALPWLHLTDDLPRSAASGRDLLAEARDA